MVFRGDLAAFFRGELTSVLREFMQMPHRWQTPQLPQRGILDLANAFATDVHHSPDGLERQGLTT
jgi:hypothetical protein